MLVDDIKRIAGLSVVLSNTHRLIRGHNKCHQIQLNWANYIMRVIVKTEAEIAEFKERFSLLLFAQESFAVYPGASPKGGLVSTTASIATGIIIFIY